MNSSEKSKRSGNAFLRFLFGEFDSGSERTLAAWIRHASRTPIAISEWRKGEEHVSDLPASLEQLLETGINTGCDYEAAWFHD